MVSILELSVRMSCEGKVVHLYSEHEIFSVAAEEVGLRSGRRLEPTEPGRPWIVLGQWDEAADYDHWLATSARAALGELLGPVLVGGPIGSIDRVAEAWH